MATMIGGVRVKELVKGFSEGMSREQGPRAAKAFFVPDWADRYTVVNALMGLTTYVVSGGSITLNSPGIYPESSNIWAQEVSVLGVGTPTVGPKQIAWTSAIVQVSYAPNRYSTSQAQDPGGVNSFDPSAPLVYASQSLDFGGQVVTLPSGTCTLNDGSNTPLNQHYGRPVGVVNMDLTLHRLPFLLPGSNRAHVGYMNSVAIWGCDPGYLLFKGAQTQREYGGFGDVITQETHIRAAYRPEAKWDTILHPTDPTKGWTQVLYNGVSVLKSFDFNGLIPSAYT